MFRFPGFARDRRRRDGYGSEGRRRRRRFQARVDGLEGRALLSGATLAAPQLAPADDSGTPGDGITNVNRPHLVGTASPGDVVQIASVGGDVIYGQAGVAADGAYSVQFSAPLADGTAPFRVQEVAPGGSVDAASPVFTLRIMTQAPEAPAAPVLDPSDAAGAGVTSDARPLLDGHTDPGAIVDLLDGAGDVLGTTTANILDGLFTIQPAQALPVGTTALRFQVHDVAGNWGAPGASAAITVVPAAQATTPVVFTMPTASPVTSGPATWVGSGGTTVTLGTARPAGKVSKARPQAHVAHAATTQKAAVHVVKAASVKVHAEAAVKPAKKLK